MSSDTLLDLKTNILSRYGWPLEAQRLHDGSRELHGDHRTLGELRVQPESTLKLEVPGFP